MSADGVACALGSAVGQYPRPAHGGRHVSHLRTHGTHRDRAGGVRPESTSAATTSRQALCRRIVRIPDHKPPFPARKTKGRGNVPAPSRTSQPAAGWRLPKMLHAQTVCIIYSVRTMLIVY